MSTADTPTPQPDAYDWSPGRAYWNGLDHLLRTKGPLSPDLDPSSADTTESFLRDHCKVLIIGGGGLGCELLKNVALSGFRHIHVVDLDTIDVTNLNRQFLFRSTDVGKPKAFVAANYINSIIPSANVVAHHENIMNLSKDFYKQFNIIISGLDSIDARRYLNAILFTLLQYDDDGNVDQSCIIPLIDGGTEGFQGQARVIIPTFSACFECTLSLFPPQTSFPLCTIANTPRLPEHCIEYAHVILWDRLNPFGKNTKLDKDSVEHMQWIYEKAKARASNFGIHGVTFRLTQGVTKNIIPAVASTNAIVAAACANEAIKMISSFAKNMDNYSMYNGNNGIYNFTYKNEKRTDCPVCGTPAPHHMSIKPDQTLQHFIDMVANDPHLRSRKPFLTTDQGKTLYADSPPPLRKATEPNLKMEMSSFFASPSSSLQITLTDRDLPFHRTLILTLPTSAASSSSS